MPVKLIALAGQMYTGKSTLARYLHDHHNYILADYAKQLRQLAAKALSVLDDRITPENIEQDKRKYRPFLQELGNVIGYNAGGSYIDDLLNTWYRHQEMTGEILPVVFDNCRTWEQWEHLQLRGFTLVRLHCQQGEHIQRAAAAGVRVDELNLLLSHAVEQQWRRLLTEPNARDYDTAIYSPERIAYFLTTDVGARGAVRVEECWGVN